MSSSIKIIDVTDLKGNAITLDWLAKAEPVHRQLRPLLPHDYIAKMRRVFIGGGRMCVAVREDKVVGVAVYRIYENTAHGIEMYVDDLTK
jgi:hypothetical protein